MRGACVAIALMTLTLAACGGGGAEPTENSNNTTTPTQPGGGGGGGSTGGSTSNQVVVSDNLFEPSQTTVTSGTTVTWTWSGGNYSEHNVTFMNTALGGSGNKTSGTYSKEFSTTGSYGYMCSIHGSSMSGTVVVQ